MLTYTPPDPRRPQKTHEKPWLLLLMAFAWLWPGVFSHDLWNPAEPSLFTASESMRNGGSLLVAQIFGQPDFTISPAFLWAATAFQTLFSPWAADAYDAARFAGVVFTAIGLTASVCRFQLSRQTPRPQRCLNPYRQHRFAAHRPLSQSHVGRLCRVWIDSVRLFTGTPPRHYCHFAVVRRLGFTLPLLRLSADRGHDVFGTCPVVPFHLAEQTLSADPDWRHRRFPCPY